MTTRSHHHWLRGLSGSFLSLIVAFITCFTWTPATPRGVQCPTAPVQKVVSIEYVRNCCGKLVPKETVRAPREGEPEFKQCRCAEKKSAEKQEESKSAEPRPQLVFDVRISDHSEFGHFIVIAAAPIEVPIDSGCPAPIFSPPTPPPQVIT